MESSFVGRYANACEEKFQFRLRQDNYKPGSEAARPHAGFLNIYLVSSLRDAATITANG
jgi:hypothetical protein